MANFPFCFSRPFWDRKSRLFSVVDPLFILWIQQGVKSIETCLYWIWSSHKSFILHFKSIKESELLTRTRNRPPTHKLPCEKCDQKNEAWSVHSLLCLVVKWLKMYKLASIISEESQHNSICPCNKRTRPNSNWLHFSNCSKGHFIRILTPTWHFFVFGTEATRSLGGLFFALS